jgi:hypothetical protein
VRALAHNNLGTILCDAEDNARSRIELAEAIALGTRVGYTRFFPETFSTLAILDLREGNLASAEANARRGMEIALESESRLNAGVAARVLAGILARDANRAGDVADTLARARALVADDDYERARLWALESKLSSDDELREKARAVFTQLGAQLDLDKLADPDDVR